MSLLDILAVLLVLSAVFGWFNHRYLKLPHTIGLVVIALAASGVIVAAEWLRPELGIGTATRSLLQNIDFHKVLMEGFLSALLFAGAVHIDMTEMAQRKWAILLMSTLGVLLSTFIVGGLIWWISGVIGIDMPPIWALVFGALISPTDPVAVLSILKRVRVPAQVKAKIAGESLFNDGVGIVVFTIILALAMGGDGHGGAAASGIGASGIGIVEVATLFAGEALGGAALGFAAGLVAYWLMKTIDEHNIEVMITLALVTGVYALSLALHASGPIAVVIAGLLIGNHGKQFAMGENTRRHIFEFWELSDEILNSILFLLIGLEILVVGVSLNNAWLAVAAIPIVLFARWIAVAVPLGLLRLRMAMTPGAVRILTWGGLRGGISVALALSLPETEWKGPILAATYGVVVFSIIVQGLTVEHLVRRVVPAEREQLAMAGGNPASFSRTPQKPAHPPAAGQPKGKGGGSGSRAKRRNKGK